jgi:hypothetical protein
MRTGRPWMRRAAARLIRKIGESRGAVAPTPPTSTLRDAPSAHASRFTGAKTPETSIEQERKLLRSVDVSHEPMSPTQRR